MNKKGEKKIIDEEKEVNTKNSDAKAKEPSTEEKLKNAEEKILRLMAEAENQRRRFEKEKLEAFEFGGYNFAKESLALLDNIDRAIISFKNDEKLKKNDDIEKIIDGIEVVKSEIISIFKKNGIESIECLNNKFDPNLHEAMLEVESNSKEPGIVVEEIQKGYLMKGRLLRPSLVGVTKKVQKDEKKDENTKKYNENKEK